MPQTLPPGIMKLVHGASQATWGQTKPPSLSPMKEPSHFALLCQPVTQGWCNLHSHIQGTWEGKLHAKPEQKHPLFQLSWAEHGCQISEIPVPLPWK